MLLNLIMHSFIQGFLYEEATQFSLQPALTRVCSSANDHGIKGDQGRQSEHEYLLYKGYI